MNPKLLGELSEASIVLALLRHDLTVLRPYGDSQRYDLVIEKDDRFFRVQCKTGRLVRGVVTFPTCSSYAHRGLGKRDYRGQVDFFAVYCPDNDKTYIVPVDAVGRTACNLRVQASRNGQREGVRPAEVYEVGKFSGPGTREKGPAS